MISNKHNEITKKAKAQQNYSKTKSHTYRNKENHAEQYGYKKRRWLRLRDCDICLFSYFNYFVTLLYNRGSVKG